MGEGEGDSYSRGGALILILADSRGTYLKGALFQAFKVTPRETT